MTALAGNNYFTMPYIEQPSYDNLSYGNNGFVSVEYPEQFVKAEFFHPQKQPLQLQVQQTPSQQSQQSQQPELTILPISGSTSPQPPVMPSSGSTSPQPPMTPLMYSQNSQLSQYGNNNEPGVKFEPALQIKTEFDRYDYRGYGVMDNMPESVSSVESSPHHVASNDFENSSQPFNYNYPPALCDDSASETLSSATSPITGHDFSFAISPENVSRYYADLLTNTQTIEQNSGVQQPYTDQMRFIIYEPRSNDNNASLVPNINTNHYGIPMWQLPIQNSVDSKQYTSTSQGTMPSIPFDYSQNQILVNPAQINPIPSASSSTQQQTQSTQSGQSQQQQLIKCPHEDCPKTFSRLYNLKAHLRSHSPARPYQCPMCPRSFSRKHDLQRHIRVHTGVKPYQCPCCRKAFARTDALRRHFKMEETCRNSPEVANMKTRRRYSDLH